MQEYLADGTIEALPPGFVLTERFTRRECSRKGLVLALDLECYDYAENASSLVRPTEKTVIERIQPRLEIRKSAAIELPHIMILIDDPERTVIEPLFRRTEELRKLYDTELMQDGGRVKGWFVPEGDLTNEIRHRLDALWDREWFNNRYQAD